MNQERLIKVAKRLLQVEDLPYSAEISIVLTTDEHIHHLNSAYRGKDCPTDVLSFQQLDGDEIVSASDEPVLLGDVVISVETAARQASDRGKLLDEELSLLVAHGILHLLGHDDETDEGAERMRERESAILESI